MDVRKPIEQENRKSEIFGRCLQSKAFPLESKKRTSSNKNTLPILEQAKTGSSKLCNSSCCDQQEEAPTLQPTLQQPHLDLPAAGEGTATLTRAKSSRNNKVETLSKLSMKTKILKKA
ncbi:hypothetical protein M9H77_29842 [Catharanthus roseus]|uniref:Uncharacterized protein n=1 Tax=Catharanthus roseus TaxID=4058 RepID=A0ACB9ZXG1_CATRO|nr:hypothetical protein M9H77_29842 [Catharanthus roseus]